MNEQQINYYYRHSLASVTVNLESSSSDCCHHQLEKLTTEINLQFVTAYLQLLNIVTLQAKKTCQT